MRPIPKRLTKNSDNNGADPADGGGRAYHQVDRGKNSYRRQNGHTWNLKKHIYFKKIKKLFINI